MDRRLVVSSVLLLLLFTIVRTSMGESCEWVGTTHGGCPDLDACARKCLNCFKGIGKIIGGCFSKGSGQPSDECRCYFVDGAPCEKDCLRRAAVYSGGSAVRTFNNGTHVIITKLD